MIMLIKSIAKRRRLGNMRASLCKIKQLANEGFIHFFINEISLCGLQELSGDHQ